MEHRRKAFWSKHKVLTEEWSENVSVESTVFCSRKLFENFASEKCALMKFQKSEI